MSTATCRLCGAALHHTFIDLGLSPLCEAFVPEERRNMMEPFFPLHVWVCSACFLVQLEEYARPDEIFSEYAYFSSFSESWLAHARRYVERVSERFGLGPESHVVEIASNDGYLLQFFVERGIPVTGIEPAANVAEAARAKGVPTEVRFFGRETAAALAAQGIAADQMVANNVLAHVPDIHDFVGGVPVLLKPEGVATFEFQHLLRMVQGNQFDTIYHEHFCYLSLIAVRELMGRHGLRVFDVEELSTHGGSLRVYVCHEGASHRETEAVARVAGLEEAEGLRRLDWYSGFASRVDAVKYGLIEFLIDARRRGKTVAGYGAPGKGNTLLNYCGIKSDLLPFTVDRNPYKHGRYCPGSRIPIYPVERLIAAQPDYVLIMPWNLRDEIMMQMREIAAWGGQFVVAIPSLQCHEPPAAPVAQEERIQ
ncbi:MAG: methyltransferase domain-containing protein [Candidatus Hydrogenedentes bacterium]|nr:methyltransferase domain-containing protein [Candidatus Hydrogenedentota bacterium]